MKKETLSGRADVHLHTSHSDGLATPRQTLDYIAIHRPYLDVIAITDHDHLDSSLWAYTQRDRYPFDIIPGMEVTSRDGHILALWVSRLIPRDLSLEETVAAIHEQNGIAIIAHPFEPTIAPRAFLRYLKHPEVLIQVGIDAVEIFNAGAVTPGNNWLACHVFKPLNIPVVGNSDAHTPDCIGRGMTCFQGHTADDFRQALVSSQTAVEGRLWPVTVYLRLLPSSIQQKLNVFSGTSARSTRPTQP